MSVCVAAKHTQVKVILPVLNPGLKTAKALANKAVKVS